MAARVIGKRHVVRHSLGKRKSLLLTMDEDSWMKLRQGKWMDGSDECPAST